MAWGIALVLLLTEGMALAEEAAAPVLSAGDTAWVLTSSALVMLMTPGLALFYAGMVRKKNVLSTSMHSFVALAVIGIQWVVLGYSLAFGAGNTFIGDLSMLFLSGITPESLSGTIPTYVFMWFQGMFAIITPALISGTIAERMKFSTYVVFILLWATLVYDPVAHWVWGGGWIQKMGALDFAGGTVVHLSSGASALAMAFLLGKRKGFPGEDFVPHNLTMTLLGVGLLWFGWFGFNAGSALGANATAGLAFTTTMIASAAAGFSWMMMEWIFHKKPSALGLGSGVLAGLVVITPACGFVTPFWAIVLGLIAGVLCYYGIRIKGLVGFDDSLDVVGIHGVGGAFGAIGTGIFASIGGSGWIAGDPAMVGKQFLSVLVVAVYAFVVTYVMGWVLDKIMGLRADEEAEVMGLDRELHGEVGYTL
ncbi:ammonium transporter [Desulforhabdus amnigena]|uniref:ammonium transporter n=1 Tax=Desulforhabdus amnigena TaxID=40218 RepID=UPI0035A2347D